MKGEEVVTRQARTCARCSEIIERGEAYIKVSRNRSATSTKPAEYSWQSFCLPCFAATGGEVAERGKRVPERKKRARRIGDPLLGVGHLVHGLGVVRP
jgi:hypothetical protein